MDLLVAVAIVTAAFVGINIGGSSTGVAFGPSVGSRLISKPGAAALMTVFALIGGWTVGRNVVATMGGKIVPGSMFSPVATVVILFFIGVSLLISNLSGVPASTSMTAVGAIAGLGIATGTIEWSVMGWIVSWWLVSPVIAFLLGGLVGRYLYVHLDGYFHVSRSPGKLLEFERSLSPVSLEARTTLREVLSSFLVLAIACYMAFSAGASNVANAIAPLVGSGMIEIGPGIFLAIGAMSLGGFTIARKTLDTVGDGITDLPLLAALVVSVISASIITVLSWMGVPASLAISATMAITGLGWGRASRTVKLSDLPDETPELNHSALKQDRKKKIGDEDPEDHPEEKLFDPDIVAHVVTLWILTPSISAFASFLVFQLVSMV